MTTPLTSCTRQSLEAVIARFGGMLTQYAHPAQNACCVLEARSLCLQIPWTDDPVALGVPDIRPLNDAHWSSATARTAAMIRLVSAYDTWAHWPVATQRAVIDRIIIDTVREIVADLPTLPEPLRTQCRVTCTVEDAARAAAAALVAVMGGWEAGAARIAWEAAQEATQESAQRVAETAALVALAPARAAAAALVATTGPGTAETADRVLTRGVDLWIAAADNRNSPTDDMLIISRDEAND